LIPPCQNSGDPDVIGTNEAAGILLKKKEDSTWPLDAKFLMLVAKKDSAYIQVETNKFLIKNKAKV
jgi:hypothetical protein